MKLRERLSGLLRRTSPAESGTHQSTQWGYDVVGYGFDGGEVQEQVAEVKPVPRMVLAFADVDGLNRGEGARVEAKVLTGPHAGEYIVRTNDKGSAIIYVPEGKVKVKGGAILEFKEPVKGFRF